MFYNTFKQCDRGFDHKKFDAPLKRHPVSRTKIAAEPPVKRGHAKHTTHHSVRPSNIQNRQNMQLKKLKATNE